MGGLMRVRPNEPLTIRQKIQEVAAAIFAGVEMGKREFCIQFGFGFMDGRGELRRM